MSMLPTVNTHGVVNHSLNFVDAVTWGGRAYLTEPLIDVSGCALADVGIKCCREFTEPKLQEK